MQIHESAEDYLETILRLSKRQGQVRSIDIVNELKKPGRDARDDAPEVVFSRSALSIDDLEPGMELKGTVRNVVDFGAFVDVGVHQDGLVHISKLADRRVEKVEDVVNIGDMIWVKVTDIDDKGRVNLSYKDAIKEIKAKNGEA